jgi:single-strand DNA-binding protein
MSTEPNSSTTTGERLAAVGRHVSPGPVNGPVDGIRVVAVREESAMFETPFTIVGNIVTDPVHRRVGEHAVVKFRVASNSRRRTTEGAWEQGDSLFVSVSCWNRLVSGVAGLVKGDPVVVVGQLYTSEYDDREGVRRTSVEVRATAVGPDLARSTVRLERLRRSSAEQAPDMSDDISDAPGEDPADQDVDQPVEGLPLTA